MKWISMKRACAYFSIAITALSFAGPARAQSTSTITLTNGPPNIPYAAPGSCTTTTCTWIQAGISGEAVSNVYLDMVPMSQNYTGTFTLSGTNASNYNITTSSDGTRNVGHITTASALSAGDDSITVSANGVSQNLTVHKVSGTTPACSDSGIRSASNSAGSGGIILIPASCTLSLTSTFIPSASNQVFIGAGSATSVISQNGSFAPGITYGSPPGVRGVAWMNLAFTGFTANYHTETLQMSNGWVIRNSYFHDNAQGATVSGCPSYVYNNQFMHNTYSGLGAGGGISYVNPGGCSSANPQYVVGNEWAQNNTGQNDTENDAGQKWISGVAFTLNLYNNYAHDNYEHPLWSDTEQAGVTWNIYDNTFIGNGGSFLIEQSGAGGGTQSFNVYQNFFEHNYDGTNPQYNGSGGSYGPDTNIAIGAGSCCINLHDNNFVLPVSSNGTTSDAWRYSNENGNLQNNVVAHDNTVNFLSTSNNGFGNAAIFYNPSAVNPSGTVAYSNHYHMVGGSTSDAHFNWFQSGNGAFTFSQWQAAGAFCDGSGHCSSANPDTSTSGGAGTVDTASNQQGTGCTHIACSGSGIGAGGVPIAAPTAPSIQSIALSNSTFTPNVANGAVGTVAVTMSNGSAFTGALSITGTNSGGFHLSGNTLEEKATSGTPAGTYHDFNIVATQSTAANSPQQISPTVTGTASLSIQSIELSNSTFTPNVANGAVGTVAVTMSNGSAFTGTNSITGTNSGGFHLSGNTLQEKASSGTPAGTYHDFSVVATQSTAANSPQQISPTVSGAAEAPFGGTARSITGRIQAEDFDTGGYGAAYHATNACGIGIDTTYGPDRLNVQPTSDLDGEGNLKIGCNQPGDWHNYTITVPTTGVYTLGMRVANIQAGAAYHVAIDGTNVASGIAVPNTGGYDTFATVTSAQFHMTAGQHVMQIVLDTAGPSGFGGDFNWVQGTFVAACPT